MSKNRTRFDMMGKNRTRFDMVYEILLCAEEPKQRTDIFYEAKLSGTQYSKTVKLLLEKDLLKDLGTKGAHSTKTLVQRTEKGDRYIELFEQIKALIG